MDRRFRRAKTRRHGGERPVLQASLTVAETLADIAMREEILSAIPGVSLAWGVLKAKDSISDRLFAQKIVRFIEGIDSLNASELAAVQQMFANDDEARKAGETLLLVLERLTDLDKPGMLAFFFEKFARKKIDSLHLRRFVHAIDQAFPDDLRAFLEPSGMDEQEHLAALVPTGLVSMLGGGAVGPSKLVYVASPLGRLFLKLVNDSGEQAVVPSDAAG